MLEDLYNDLIFLKLIFYFIFSYLFIKFDLEHQYHQDFIVNYLYISLVLILMQQFIVLMVIRNLLSFYLFIVYLYYQ